jgi:hypothetical protein
MANDGTVTRYSVVATQAHIDAIARVGSSPRIWGPLAWLGVLAGAWFGMLLGSSLLPPSVEDHPALGWLTVLSSMVLWGWISVAVLRWSVRRRLRRGLAEGGWHVGSEHHAEFDETGIALRGPTSEVPVSYENVRGVHEDRGGILIRRRWSRTPVLSVSELFPAVELERVRRRSAERAKTGS